MPSAVTFIYNVELYKVGIWMQKCSLTTSANNRKVPVIPGHLLAGSPPAG